MSLFYTKSSFDAVDPEGIEGKEQGKSRTEASAGSVGGGKPAWTNRAYGHRGKWMRGS